MVSIGYSDLYFYVDSSADYNDTQDSYCFGGLKPSRVNCVCAKFRSRKVRK